MPGEVSTGPFITRDARREDHAAFAGFWVELGLDQAAPDIDYWDRELRPRTIFLTHHDQPIAYALTFAFGDRGDVRQIAVDPAWRKRGVGARLMADVAAKLRREGVSDWRLEVRQNNTAAIALYRSVGMDVIRELVSLRMTADQARAFAATRSGSLRVETVEPPDDATLEARWDLGRGQLARWRRARGPKARLMKIADRALAQYIPSYTPDFDLFFPLYAIDRAHAAHLFGAAMEIQSVPVQELQLPAGVAADAIIRAGARVLERLHEMGGPLPPAP